MGAGATASTDVLVSFFDDVGVVSLLSLQFGSQGRSVFLDCAWPLEDGTVEVIVEVVVSFDTTIDLVGFADAFPNISCIFTFVSVNATIFMTLIGIPPRSWSHAVSALVSGALVPVVVVVVVVGGGVEEAANAYAARRVTTAFGTLGNIRSVA